VIYVPVRPERTRSVLSKDEAFPDITEFAAQNLRSYTILPNLLCLTCM
jgi:hypothetical protein